MEVFVGPVDKPTITKNIYISKGFVGRFHAVPS